LLFSINLSNAYSLPLLYKLHEPFPFHCSFHNLRSPIRLWFIYPFLSHL
jgi:hypothetical protein